MGLFPRPSAVQSRGCSVGRGRCIGRSFRYVCPAFGNGVARTPSEAFEPVPTGRLAWPSWGARNDRSSPHVLPGVLPEALEVVDGACSDPLRHSRLAARALDLVSRAMLDSARLGARFRKPNQLQHHLHGRAKRQLKPNQLPGAIELVLEPAQKTLEKD